MSFALCGNSRLLSERFSKPSRQLIRNISFLKKVKSDSIVDKKNYKLVYDFPQALPVAAILKTKVWVPPVGIAFSPVFYVIDGTLISSILCAVTACAYGLTGFMLSKIVENTVGKIYVNKEGDVKNVIISSVNKKGQRVDRIHSLHEIINYDFPNKFQRNFGFIAVGIENSSTIYKINIRHSKLIDPAICMHLLGHIWHDNVDQEKKSVIKTNLEKNKISST